MLELSVHVPASLLTATTVAAARQSTSVDMLMRRALVEYLVDLDVGLLNMSVKEARIASRQREMVASVRSLARVGRGRAK